MSDPRFWHPTRQEWQLACQAHEDWDPEHVLFFKNGKAMAIFAKDAPKVDMNGVPVRTQEQMQKSMERRKNALKNVQKRMEHRPSKETLEKAALAKKSFTADDPTIASVANAVDIDRMAANANYIEHARRISELPKIGMDNAGDVRERVGWYFRLCMTDGIKPNLPGLALCFGLTRTGLMNAIVDRRMPRDVGQELGRGIAMIDEIVSAMTLDGRVNPVAAIYFMNNWLGYKNASEVTTRTEPVEGGVDQKALEQKYNTVVDIE